MGRQAALDVGGFLAHRRPAAHGLRLGVLTSATRRWASAIPGAVLFLHRLSRILYGSASCWPTHTATITPRTARTRHHLLHRLLFEGAVGDNFLRDLADLRYFAIPRKYQYRALVWGIIAVIVLRAS
jgi:hypothetical protein